MVDLTQDYLTTKMDQSELIAKIGWGAIKAFITSIILIVAFIKALDLINYFTSLVISQIILTIIFSLIIYYYYFWSGKGSKGELALSTHCDENGKRQIIPLTFKDFLYTDKMSSEANAIALITSFVGGTVAELGFLVLMFIVKYSVEHSNSDETMSLLRVVVIGVAATGLYIYTQRNVLDKNFWGIILRCTVYGFSLSGLAWLLGIIIGVSNMVLGIPITLAILVLQFTFTSFYTYTDLLEWAKHTHKVEIENEERKQKKIEEEKKKAEESATSGMKTEV
jgi:hypothetical protein